MTGLFIEFRDPLFGIIIFFLIIFIVAFFSYWWGRYKLKERSKTISRFAKEFHRLPTDEELASLLAMEHISDGSIRLLAQTFVNNGDFEKAIELYQNLLERQTDGAKRLETMLLLGEVYFKAGFLARAKEVFLQILKLHPRTPKALEHLLLIYEYLKEYDNALEVLEPLEELGIDAKRDRLYLKLVAVIQDGKRTNEEKCEAIIAHYQKERSLSYLVYEFLFKHDTKRAWQILDDEEARHIPDLLWRLARDRVDFAAVQKLPFALELYSAKGYIDGAQSSEIFELDTLLRLRCAEKRSATIRFEYLCDECKQVFPFLFHRCPNCHAIESAQCEMILTKEMDEKDHHFQ